MLPAIKIGNRWYVDIANAKKLKEIFKTAEQYIENTDGIDSDNPNGEQEKERQAD